MSRVSMLPLLALAVFSLEQPVAAQKTKLIRSHEVLHGGVVRAEASHPHHHEKPKPELEELVSVKHRSKTRIPTEPLISGSPVKIKNRKSNSYLSSCTSCQNILTDMSRLHNMCPNLLGVSETSGEGLGCMYVADDCLGGNFQIIKVGFSLNTKIHSGDLVLLKSMPSKNGDSDYYAYVGTCGTSDEATCEDTAAVVRLYKGNSSNPAALKPMQQEIMWTIHKEMGEGEVLLGEYITLTKASVANDQAGDGTSLSACGSDKGPVNTSETSLPHTQCGARQNVYTRQASRATAQENLFYSQWVVEATPDVEPTCTDSDMTALMNTNPGLGQGAPSEPASGNGGGGSGSSNNGGSDGGGGDDGGGSDSGGDGESDEQLEAEKAADQHQGGVTTGDDDDDDGAASPAAASPAAAGDGEGES